MCALRVYRLADRTSVSLECVPQLGCVCIPLLLRHRLLLTYEAEASGLSASRVIDMLLEQVPVA